MNCCRVFLSTVVVVFFTQQSTGLDLGPNLCLGVNLGNLLGIDIGCQTKPTPLPVVTTTNPPVEETPDPKVVLATGFSGCKNTLSTAENKSVDGIAHVSELLQNYQTADAVQALQKSYQDTEDLIYHAGDVVFQSLGASMDILSEEARQNLVEASKRIQVVGMEALDILRNAILVANQGISVGGDTARQAVQAALQSFRAAFAGLYYIIPISYQQAMDAVSIAQNQSVTTQVQILNQNADAAANDNDISAACSEIIKAAADSINNGSSPDKVNKLKESIISSLGDLAQVASHIKSYSTYVQYLAEADPSSAKSIYIEQSENVFNRIQVIVANIYLNYGAAGIKSNNLVKKQIAEAIVDIAHGNDEVTIANKNAKQLTLLALEFPGNVRNMLFNSAANSAAYGKIALNQRIVEGTQIVFNAI